METIAPLLFIVYISFKLIPSFIAFTIKYVIGYSVALLKDDWSYYNRAASNPVLSGAEEFIYVAILCTLLYLFI